MLSPAFLPPAPLSHLSPPALATSLSRRLSPPSHRYRRRRPITALATPPSSTSTSRAMAALTHDIPLLLSHAPRHLSRDMISPTVRMTFPVGPPMRGRRSLLALLWSLPYQATVGMTDARVVDVTVTREGRQARFDYDVECEGLGKVVGVRMRVGFDDMGRVDMWEDTWDRALEEVIKSMTKEEEEVDDAWEEEAGEDYGRLLADRLQRKVAVLEADEAMAKAMSLVEYLNDGFLQKGLPGGGMGKSVMNLDGYDMFHADVVVETEGMVVQGRESVSMFHAVARADGVIRFHDIGAVCLDARVLSAKVVEGRFLMRGKWRTGGAVQRMGFARFRLNDAGEIVHCFLEQIDGPDEFYDTFKRTGNQVWLG